MPAGVYSSRNTGYSSAAVASDDTPLQVRAAAARALIAAGELEPAAALSWVVWPSAAVADASASRDGNAGRRERALALVESGVSWADAAGSVGVTKASVGDWLRKARSATDRMDERLLH